MATAGATLRVKYKANTLVQSESETRSFTFLLEVNLSNCIIYNPPKGNITVASSYPSATVPIVTIHTKSIHN